MPHGVPPGYAAREGRHSFTGLATPSRVPLDPVRTTLGGTPLRDSNRPDPVERVLVLLLLFDLLVLLLKL
jgi:hypothetical protein